MKSNIGALRVFSLVVLTLFTFSKVACCDPAPGFSLADVDGVIFSLGDFRGSVVILNFLSSTCSACEYEVYQLKIVRGEFGGIVVIMSISWIYSADTDEKLRIRRDEWGISWILARDTEDVTARYNVPRIPTVFVIDQEGNIRYRHVDGAQASVLIEETDNLLTEMADLNSDGKVDLRDITITVKAYFSYPDHPRWNPIADVNQDNLVNMRDIAFVTRHFGETIS